MSITNDNKRQQRISKLREMSQMDQADLDFSVAVDVGDGRSELGVAVSYRNLYYSCMKTTLDINDQLLANAKVLAVQQGTSLTRLIEEGLQLRLRDAAKPPRATKPRIPVLKGRGGLVVGVNPLSNKAMLAALEDDT